MKIMKLFPLIVMVMFSGFFWGQPNGFAGSSNLKINVSNQKLPNVAIVTTGWNHC